MVYQGKPSTGCFRCRKRKIKCDETKPGCRRCSIYGQECPGYGDPFVWRPQRLRGERRVENNASEATPDRVPSSDNWTPGSESRRAASSPSNSSIVSQRPSPESPTMLLQPSVSWEQQALGYFLHHHILPAEAGISPGHLDFLPQLYSERTDSDSLRYAMLGVSYLSLFNTTGFQPLYVEARKSYGLSLHAVNAALRCREKAQDDATLASVLLLSLFVDLSGERDQLFNSHTPGIYALVRLRGKQPRESERGMALFGWALTQLQIQAIATGETKYSHLEGFTRPPDGPDPGYDAGAIACKISSFCRRSMDLAKTVSNPIYERAPLPASIRESFAACIATARELLAQLDAWEENLPGHWKCRPRDCGSSMPPPSRNQWTASFLALFRACQVVFYLSVLQLCAKEFRLASCSSTIIQSSETIIIADDAGPMLEGRIQVLLNDICATIPRALGDESGSGTVRAASFPRAAGGYMLLWPMWVVNSCRFASPEQVSQSDQALQRIGWKMGYKLALNLSREQFPLSMV